MPRPRTSPTAGKLRSGRKLSELKKLVDTLIRASGKDVRFETEPERLRPGERQTVVGNPSRLAALGVVLPSTDYADVVARVWRDVALRCAGAA